MATNFGTKLTITRLPQKIIARCFHLPFIFGPGLCNGIMYISPLKTPVVMAANRFYSKTKLAAGSQECQTPKRSCYAIYTAWQWDRYLVPQNVFLVHKANWLEWTTRYRSNSIECAKTNEGVRSLFCCRFSVHFSAWLHTCCGFEKRRMALRRILYYFSSKRVISLSVLWIRNDAYPLLGLLFNTTK